jgi:proline dehydrogenase
LSSLLKKNLYFSAAAGFGIIKAIPYGPLDEVLPYLTRRAQENRGIFDKVKKEKRLLTTELLRRLKKGQILYKK